MNQDSLIHRPYFFKTMAKHHLAQSRQLGVDQTEANRYTKINLVSSIVPYLFIQYASKAGFRSG